MGISQKLKEKALSKTLNDPKVYAQVQKNTEKILKKRERESFGRVQLFKKERRTNENLKTWSASPHPNYVTEWLRGLSAAREAGGG